MADWYYAKDGERKGPVSSSQLRQMAQSGELLPTDMVFKEGGSQWIPASSINNLFAGPNAVRADPGASGGMRRGGREPDDDLGYDDEGRYDEPPARGLAKSGGNFFLDLLLFKWMAGPWIIIALYYLGVIVYTCYTLYGAGQLLYYVGVKGDSLKAVFYMLMTIPLAIVVGRVYAELLILLFRFFGDTHGLYERFKDFKDTLGKQ
jgi:hypothetical protein